MGARTVVAGVMLFGSVIAIYQWFVQTYVAGAGSQVKVVTKMEYLPTLVASQPAKKKVMVLGSSMVAAGFDTRIFDTTMSEIGIDCVSYNYGIQGLNPKLQELITKRIQEAFRAADRKLDLTLVEFCPFQATKIRKKATALIADQNVAELATDEELWNITLADPTAGVRLFHIRYLRAGVSAELITTALMTSLAGSRPEARDAAFVDARRTNRRLQLEYRKAVRNDVADFRSLERERESRGSRSIKDKLSVETLAILKELMASGRHPALMEADLRRRVQGADIIGLEFDQGMLEAFVRMVKNLQSVSKHVAVVLFPRNTAWVRYTPESHARLGAALEFIASRTGVVIENFQEHPQVRPEHFSDTTHLSVYDGIDIFTKVLAASHAHVLRD